MLGIIQETLVTDREPVLPAVIVTTFDSPSAPNETLVVFTVIFGVGVGVLVGVGVGAAPCLTVIRTVWPLPVSVISTVPVRAAPEFLVAVKVTDDPFTEAVNHIALEFLSARSVPV